ncbi:hypothetical protein DAPPUDRAFT_101612 [Daphnia pulex]|uniref:Uncharacterized protein n=1 Tax=Daphnia pulex TaxID=6669 RepID=E9GDY4_DAPPU|nr:hypothetical protein DAPPUDRAFT_101612 [Daphnia pulex]|eukprot:EFX82167.1 hypothetical protein DAPPUDRAFT_101612 [Daphnia pulex]
MCKVTETDCFDSYKFSKSHLALEKRNVQQRVATTEVFQLVGEVRQVVEAKALKLDERTSGRQGWSRTVLDVPVPSWTKFCRIGYIDAYLYHGAEWKAFDVVCSHIVEYKCVETRYFPITATTPTTPRQMPSIQHHDKGRGTSSNLLLHPYLPDVRSSSFTAFAATTCLTSPTSWKTSVVATLCCYTPAVTHHGIMASSGKFSILAKFWISFETHLIDPKFHGDHEYVAYFDHSSMVEALWLLPAMLRKFREDGHHNVAVNPLSATPLSSPSSLARAACAFRSRGFHAAGSESRQAQNLPQGKPVIRQCTIPPCQPGLVSNGKSHFGHGSFRRGSQWVNFSVCVYMYVIVKCGGIVGGGGTTK